MLLVGTSSWAVVVVVVVVRLVHLNHVVQLRVAILGVQVQGQVELHVARVATRLQRQVAALEVLAQHALVVVLVLVPVHVFAFDAGHSSGLERWKTFPLALFVLVLLPLFELSALRLVVPLLLAPVALALSFAFSALSTFFSFAAFASSLAYPIDGGVALRDVVGPLLVGVLVVVQHVDVHGRGAAASRLLVLQVVREHHELLGKLGDVLVGIELPPGLHLGVVCLGDHLEEDGHSPLLGQCLARLPLVERQVPRPPLDRCRQLPDIFAPLSGQQRRHPVEGELLSHRVIPA